MTMTEIMTAHGYSEEEIESAIAGRKTMTAKYIGRRWSISPARYIADRDEWARRRFDLDEILPQGTHTISAMIDGTRTTGTITRAGWDVAMLLGSDPIARRLGDAIQVEHLIADLLGADADISTEA